MSSVGVPKTHPLRGSRWIWPMCNSYLHNHFARFRHDFDVPELPEKAPFYITADKSYRLYVNGLYVCRGPARGFQSHWPFDEVDLRRYLREGHNWISVEAYNPGMSCFHYIHANKAGFICAAEWKGVSIHTDEKDGKWKFGRSPGHAVDTDMVSKQLEFQEHFDAALESDDWIFDPDFKDDLWFLQRGISIWSNGFPFGQPPHEGVEPRGIPMLREEIVAPESMELQASGVAKDGWRDTKNPNWHFQLNELPSKEEWKSAAPLKSRKGSDFFEVEMPACGKGRFRAITFDLGRNTPGTLIAEVEGSEGGEVLDFHYHQHLDDGLPRFDKPYDSIIAMTSRLRLAKGRSRREFYQLMGVRAFTLVAYDAEKPLKVKLSWRTAVYPFTMKGSFKCSDKTLNEIHSICRRAQEVCSLDSYVDTPWREQAQWWGDARVQIRNTIYLDGDMRLAARGVRSIADQPCVHGLTYAHTPTCSGGCILPDFSLTWIMTIWDYYWQTGDLSIFRKQHARIKRILNYFKRPDLRTKDGLLLYDNRFWLFEDWCSIPKEPVPAFLNLWHLYALGYYERLLKAAGLAEEAKEVAREAASRRKLMIAKFFNAEKGLFEACLDLDGKFVGEPSVHDQVLALLLDLKQDAGNSMLEKRLLPFIKGEKLACATPSSFWATYLFEALDKCGHGAEAVDFIRERWAPMIPCGTTWEVFDYPESAGSSCSHAWSAHPAYHLVNILVGLRQTGVAWSEVEWRPCAPKGVSSAEASIPTPKGTLKASWTRSSKGAFSGRIELPEGVKADVELPGVEKARRRSGVFEFRGV